MRTFVSTLAVLVGAATITFAQPPRPDQPGRPQPGGDAGNVESFLARLMAFDANKDGKIQKDEVGDSRLKPLIERADGDKDGVVTRDELTALFAKESAALGAGGRGGPGPGGPGQGGPGPGAPGGRGPGMMPQPGQILPPFLQEALGVTEAQRKELDTLQKDVDAKLAKILTEVQRQQLREMRERGPRGGGPGGPGGQPPREGGGNRRPPNE
ncbi:MAG: EF-hand domain-containing protein [Planctomycetaceae bacterium]|nr:EF-hand domain-containing protein [Planctomycetaceae bacterium]